MDSDYGKVTVRKEPLVISNTVINKSTNATPYVGNYSNNMADDISVLLLVTQHLPEPNNNYSTASFTTGGGFGSSDSFTTGHSSDSGCSSDSSSGGCD